MTAKLMAGRTLPLSPLDFEGALSWFRFYATHGTNQAVDRVLYPIFWEHDGQARAVISEIPHSGPSGPGFLF